MDRKELIESIVSMNEYAGIVCDTNRLMNLPLSELENIYNSTYNNLDVALDLD